MLRYYARTLEHLLADRAVRPHSLMLESISKAFFHALAGQRNPQTPRVALRHARDRSSFARRFIAGETVRKPSPPRGRSKRAGMPQTLDYPRRKRRNDGGGGRRDARVPRPSSTRSSRSGIGRNISLKLTQLGLTSTAPPASTTCAGSSTPRGTHGFFVRIDMENSPYTRRHARHLRDAVAAGLSQRRRRPAVVPAAQRAGCARG